MTKKWNVFYLKKKSPNSNIHILTLNQRNKMHLIEVTSAATAQDFLEVQAIINAGNPNYIRPLNKEVNDVFDPLKNKNFKYGEAKRWILETDDGILVGRIAAFTNSKYINKGTDFNTGGVGFFDQRKLRRSDADTHPQAGAAQERAPVHGGQGLGQAPAQAVNKGRCRGAGALRGVRGLFGQQHGRPLSELGGLVVLLHVRRQVVATAFFWRHPSGFRHDGI